MIHRDLKVLMGAKLFSGIDAAEIENLSHFFGTNIEAYGKNEIIYSGSSFKRQLCCILKGKAYVYKTNAQKRRIVMNRLGVSDCFGMANLFSEEDEFPTEIVAAAECKILFIPHDTMIRLFGACPQIAVNYAAFLTERIHFMNKILESLSCSDLNERLLSFLSGLPMDENGIIELPFSMLELSQRLNIGRASLYRIFASLAEKGILKREGKTITMMDVRN